MDGLKDILVYVDGSPRSYITLALAAKLARRFQAHLIGLHVMGMLLPSYDPATYFDGAAGLSLAGRISESAQQVAQESERQFDKQLQRSFITGEWHPAEGMVADHVAREARYVDLTVVTQVDLANPPLGTRRQVPQEVLLSSGRPVLVVPHSGSFEIFGSHILIGWNGSREAARAVNDAMPFLVRADTVTIAVVEPVSAYEGDTVLIEDIGPHLLRHGVKAVSVRCARRESGTSGTLLDYASECGADLLVIGGYGHSRLRALVLGGVSRGVLARMTIPTLASH
jgi:nucleotide-binding universal stress UspA family protein